VYAENGAVAVLDEQSLEQQPSLLVSSIVGLLADSEELEQMRSRFHEYAKPQAAEDVADMILTAVKKP
jgi:UDP-N-acetylglucosamine:LPS N-acetylglucosamine transferase